MAAPVETKVWGGHGVPPLQMFPYNIRNLEFAEAGDILTGADAGLQRGGIVLNG